MDSIDLEDLADEAFDSLDEQLDHFDASSRSRGMEYLHQSRVGAVHFAPGLLGAQVRGSRQYTVEWRWRDGVWEPVCDCPVGPWCKHSYALASSVLRVALSKQGIAKPELEVLLGAAESDDVTAHRPSFARPSRPPVPLAPRRTELSDLRGHSNDFQRAAVLARLLREADLADPGVYSESFRDVLQIMDPDVMCWSLAQELARRLGGRLPAPLEPFRDRPELAERAATLARAQIRTELARWADTRSRAGERSVRLELTLAPARAPGAVVQPVPRVTTARMNDQPRTIDQLRQMHQQSRRDPGQLSSPHADLIEALLQYQYQQQALSFSLASGGASTTPIARLLTLILPSPDVRWSDTLDPAVTARAGITPGEIVRFDPRPARMLPALDPEEDGQAAVLALTASWPDGRQVPIARALLLHARGSAASERPFAVVCGGVLSPLADSLPDELLRTMLRVGGVRVPRAEAAPFVRALSRAMPDSAAQLGALAAVHAVRPTVAITLDERDRLGFRVIAQTRGAMWPADDVPAAGEHVFEFGADGHWSERASGDDLGNAEHVTPLGPAGAELATESEAPLPPAEHARAWLHTPDPACVAAALEWLRSTGAKPNTRDTLEVPWSVALSPRTIAAVADAWEHRPPGVRWLGDRRTQALLGSGHSLRPRVSAKRSGVDLLAVSAEWESELLSISDADLAKLRAARTPWVRLSGGWARREAAAVHDDAMDVLADLGIEPGAGAQTLSLWQLAQARPESLDALEQLGLDANSLKAVRELRARVASFSGLPETPVPRGLTAELRPYQRRGLDFLAWTSSMGLGAVLADDMGLGKTVQALAWLLHLRALKRSKAPALVVCPASVVHNWEREARQFAPKLRVLVLAAGAERAAGMSDLATHDLVITNYALLRRDADAWREQKLFAVIADEAQMIKNPAAAVSQAMCELNASYRLALTGTPLENRALDLWSIVRFVNPGYLGSERSFLQRFDRVDAPPHARALLAAKLRPILLRRLKRDVAPELPERIEERRDCEMTDGQRKLYLGELSRARAEVQKMSAAGVGRHKIEILSMLTRLRQICCHPQLVGAKANVGSGKFEALFDLLEPLSAEGHKVLVFSQFVKALDLVRTEMKRRGIPHFLLTGATTDRRGVVRDFEQCPDACAFLISLRAGGTGLNLTAASYVVLLDPWWNPAVEAQAIDRTHRIGQDRTVIAYRLLMQGTIEEKIWELQQRKAALAANVLGEDGFAKALDREALEYLFAEE